MAVPFSRREFLIGCGELAALTFLPSPDPAAAIEFHLQPHYRDQIPLEPMLQKRIAGSDSFILEEQHDRIAGILDSWSEALRGTGNRTDSIAQILAPDFEGSSLARSANRVIHKESAITVSGIEFRSDLLPPHPFLEDLATYLRDLQRVVTAEFQVTAIEERADKLLTTVRYQFVGAGESFYREQRTGIWHLEWTRPSPDTHKLQRWSASTETRAQSATPLFQDITRHAFSANESYAKQLSRGVDEWRTVLDAASRIDIYGHNGVAVGDVDGDGFDDLYVCQPAGLPNRLYRNRGDGTFEDVTERSGVGLLDNTACALFADFSNRGRQDLLIVRASGPVLFVNDGSGKFEEKPDAFHFASEPQGTFTGAALSDYNRDGFLDVYFCLYVYYQGTGQYKYPTPYYDANNGPPNFLMKNNGDGTFSDVTAQAGLNANNTRYSFCCAWADFDNDGWPDLYVVNDFGRKNLYRNNRDGTFTDVTAQSRTEDIGAGMSVCWFDYDNDGAEDLYVANMWTAAGERITMQPTFRDKNPQTVRALYHKHAMGNSLLRNRANAPFQDATSAAGVGMGRWSWSSDAWDFNHDGLLDIYVTNGMVSGPNKEDLNSFFWRQVVANSPDEAKSSPQYEQAWSAINELIRADYSWSGYERNVFYLNNGDGTFSDVSGALNLDFSEDGRSFALADFDRDGRLELVLKNRNAPQLRFMKNVAQKLPASVALRLRGTQSNRDAIGATITIETTSGKQTRTLQAGSGFLSQHTKDILFGIGAHQGPVTAHIRWPNGALETLTAIPPNHLVFVEEGKGVSRTEPFSPKPLSVPEPQQPEPSPTVLETWLLSPLPAPNFTPRNKPALLCLLPPQAAAPWQSSALAIVSFTLKDDDDTAAIYNLLYRSLFDRHRDLILPAYLLVDDKGYIVKVYQGTPARATVEKDSREVPKTRAERLSKALPFRGNDSSFEFGRNYLSLGSVYFQRGYFDSAEIWFNLALQDDPTSAEAQYGIGSVYLKQGKVNQAQTCFKQATQLNAGYPETKPNAWNNLGLIAVQAGQTDAAIDYFQKAIQINPDHLIALENLGNAYRREKQWDQARLTLERALSISPDDPAVNYSLAMVFAQLDQTDRAFGLLERALQLRPDYPEAMNNLGVLYLRTHRRDEAVAQFEKCIRLSPTFDQSYLNLARVYYIEGTPDKARQVLLDLLKQNPDDQQAQRALEQIK